MLSALLDAEVEFLLIGGHAVASYDYIRATKDLDLWIRATPDNVQRLWCALTEFGAPLDQMKQADFLAPKIIFQIGVPPGRIDVVTSIEGVHFDEAWPRREIQQVWGLKVPVIGLDDLIANKRAVNRTQDQADVEQMLEVKKRTRP